jgi:hypothetical protein
MLDFPMLLVMFEMHESQMNNHLSVHKEDPLNYGLQVVAVLVVLPDLLPHRPA